MTTIALFGLFVIILTEALSALHLIARAPVVIAWGVILVTLLASRRVKLPELRIPPMSLQGWALVGIATVTLLIGILSPPRHPDSLTYHVPRILHWIQNGTLDPYPTHIDRQIWIGAGAEYFLLHIRLIAGTDRILTLVQWLSFIGLAPVVALIARELGASKRGEFFAALFALTIPMSITQATGSQADVFASFWLCVSVVLLLRARRLGVMQLRWFNALALGSALGLAVLAKAVNALYLAPFIVWILVSLVRKRSLMRLLLLAAIAVVPAVAVNAPQVYRNYVIWGNPLGVPARHGVANEVISPASIASNVLRNVSLHTSTRFPTVNGLMELGILKAHAMMGIDASDPRTTFRANRFRVHMKGEDEGMSGNRWHLILIVAAMVLALKQRSRSAALMLASVAVGALLFAAYLKWQPWNSRLHLPLFVVAAGAVAAVLERSMNDRWLKMTGWFLLFFSLLPLFRNVSAPVLARQPFFMTSYESRLYPPGGWGENVLPEAIDLIAGRGCSRVGLAWQGSAPEYPVWKLLEWKLPRGTEVEIRHVAVLDETRRFASARDRAFDPCAVLSIELPKLFPPLIPPGYSPVWHKRGLTVWLPGENQTRDR